MSSPTKARVLLLATALLWGLTFTLVKTALADSTPLLFNLVRFTLATLTMVAIHHRSLRSLTAAQIKAGAFTGFFLALGYQLQTLGLAHTSATNSAFLTGLVVVIVPGLTVVPAFRPPGVRRPGLAALAGGAAAFTGLVFLTTPAGASISGMHFGDVLSLACAFAFAAHLLTLGRFAQTLPSHLLATLQIGFATLFMLLTLPLEPHPHAHFTPQLVATLAVCAVLATAAAFTVQSYAQQHLPPTQTVLLLALEPVFGAVSAMLLLHQALSGRTLLGGALILAGILITELLPTAHTTEIPA